MAYCLKCGAYIPDGQTVCLACGFDPIEVQRKAEEERRQSGSAAYQYQNSRRNEDLRRKLDEQRKRSQEQNRQWAEQERQRREEQAAREEARRRQQEESRQWAQQEYEKRQAEQQSRTVDFSETPAKEGNRALAALSYLSVLFALPYIFTPDDQFAKYHAKQGLKLFLFGIAADFIGALTGFGWIATLARLYLIFKGMSNALNGIKIPLPWIGTLGEK